MAVKAGGGVCVLTLNWRCGKTQGQQCLSIKSNGKSILPASF